MNPGLTKNYIAVGALQKYRIAKHDTADGQVSLADGSAAALMGVTHELDTADGERIDVHRTGLVEVEYGGTVAKGDPLTSDATGRAVVAAPAAGVNAEIIGHAEVAGVLGDIGSCLMSRGTLQG
ncbi:DUF2190 family protein [Parvibaculaceae bacterium PLY_AMNH_Bact1]|nr:DUF2190 family protein [Parvibaculaceae bacterium PLY_AMNH_Bact1]